MRILLLNPPFYPKFSRSSRSPAVTRSGALYYPIYLSLCAAMLRKKGFEIHLLDAPAEDMDRAETLKFIISFKPDLIVMDTCTPSIHNDLLVAESVREVYDCFIVMVGTHVSAMPEDTLRESPAVDAVARREYDETILELAQMLREGSRKLEHIKGLSYKESLVKALSSGESSNTDFKQMYDGVLGRWDGYQPKVVHNEDREPIEDLDVIPFASEVYKEFLPVENYFYGANRYPVVTIITGRGCPFQCDFCVLPQTITGNRYRYRSISNVLDEVGYILENIPDVKEIFFEDDTLTVNRDRLVELCEGLLERNYRIAWSTNSRYDMDTDILEIMKKAGCRLLCVGFESGSQKQLDGVRKNVDLSRAHAFMRRARSAGILVHGCFIMGTPGETRETMMKTLKLAMKLNPDTAQFYPMMVYPGTRAYERIRDEGHLTTEDYRNWLTPEGLHNTVVSGKNLSPDDLVKFCDYSRKKFYFRPSYLGKKIFQSVFSSDERRRILRASRTFFKYVLRK